MKICILTVAWPPKCGGSGFYAYELANALCKKGHTVTVYTNKSETKTEGRLRVVNIKSRTPHLLFYNLTLRRHEKDIAAEKFDVILHNEVAGVMLSRKFFSTQKNVMALHHQTDKEYALTLSRKIRLKLVQVLQDRMATLADGITFLANQARQQAIEKYKLTKQTFLVPCIVTLPSDNKPKPVRNERPVIYYPSGASNNYERKGFVEFIPVIDTLIKSGYLFDVIVSGGSSHIIETLKTKVAQEHLTNVVFTPNLSFEEVMSLYDSADIIAFTSRYEGFGRPIIEGISHGKPVVTFDVGIASEVIQNGKNGFIVANHSEAETTIARLLEDAQLRQTIAASARATNLSQFDEASIVTAFEQMVKDLS